jgi:hypothetical protein
MVDTETFLITLYVQVDDFVKFHLPKEVHPGPQASISPSEVVTLAILGQWARFPSESDFYRYANKNLRSAFPNLPDQSQFNRLVRQHLSATIAFALHLSDILEAEPSPYETIDGMAVEVRDRRRRGHGWLEGLANIGWSNRLGWYEGFYLLISNTATGVVTGFGLGPASTNDRRMAETFFAARSHPDPQLPSVGRPIARPYLADKGFAGSEWQSRWRDEYGAQTICLPQVNNPSYWPKTLRRWHAGLRQIAETVHAKLACAFRLQWERPHTLDGLLARLAAMLALHNFCIWLNRLLGRPNLAFADLIDW